jgi:hypothetical protein
MPTIYRENGFRFFFYTHEGNEPAHVHVIGKGGEMMDQLTFESKWAETLFNDAYTDFLTPSEITSVLKGQDMWMSADQVIERLNARQELKKAAEEAAKAEKPVETHASR